jgi:hypothetical protein
MPMGCPIARSRRPRRSAAGWRPYSCISVSRETNSMEIIWRPRVVTLGAARGRVSPFSGLARSRSAARLPHTSAVEG